MKKSPPFKALEFDLPKAPHKNKKIAIVTPDFSGPVINGGVGTAYTELAQALAAAGHQVTVILVARFIQSEISFYYWQEFYWKKNIKLISLPEPEISLEGFNPVRESHAVYLYLKNLDFEIIHFPDMGGLGYSSLQAKQMGLAFQKSTICVILHGPTLWHKSGNLELFSSIEDLFFDYLERKSVEMADILVSPSDYALRWSASENWKIPQRTFVEQYVFPERAIKTYCGPRSHFKEIIFFGGTSTPQKTKFCNFS